MKGDLAIRPIDHQKHARIEAHLFVSFHAYCIQVTLKSGLPTMAPGLTSKAVLEKFAAMHTVDVHIPTTDGRKPVLSRYTQPDLDQQLLLQQMHLPEQPPPKIASHALL